MQASMAVPGVDAATEGAVASGDASAQSLTADDDLVLDVTDDGEVTLQVMTPRGHRVLGTFDNARDAWAVVGRIDVEAARCTAGRSPAPARTRGRR